ncbi:putative DNA-binding protein [Garciella nitratireducens]|nr:putative DNA-binding protein [Garciella nitratireducens]
MFFNKEKRGGILLIIKIFIILDHKRVIDIEDDAKPMKDLFYELVTEPTKESFQNFVESTIGEDNIDFKREWIDREELCKLFLAMANSGGGILIFGIAENENGDFEPIGIETLMDSADIQNKIEKYVPASLKYKIYNFCFEDSKYDKLKGKNFQMVLIEDVPEKLPFLSID